MRVTATLLTNVTGQLDGKLHPYLAYPSKARERHALAGQVPPYRQQVQPNPNPAILASPPAAIVQTFTGSVAPVMLRPGRAYFRVVGCDSRPNGPFWAEQRPANEDDMRRDLALLNEWNGDHGLVTLIPKRPIPAWRGRAAPQRASGSLPGHLPGGAIQLWVPPGTLGATDGTWTIEQL